MINYPAAVISLESNCKFFKKKKKKIQGRRLFFWAFLFSLPLWTTTHGDAS